MRIFKVMALATSLAFLPIQGFSQNIHKNSNARLEFQVIQEQINFDAANIKKASLIESKDGTFGGLQIELNPSASSDLTRVSEAGIGKCANLVLNKKIITSATIRSQLRNKFIIKDITKEDAQNYIDSLKNP